MNLTGQHIIGASDSAEGDAKLHAINPATGNPLAPAFYEATAREIARAMELAAEAAIAIRQFPPERFAVLCDTVADNLEAEKDAITARCMEESGYPAPRVAGEFGRTVSQLRQFAGVARQGAWLQASIDHAAPDREPVPKPDVRCVRRPVGVVVVFGASNFPLALSAAGGDTASALAAGCPVVVKGHPSHPGTCELAARAIASAITSCGFPAGMFSMLQGESNEVGAALVNHESAAAVGFTGSLKGGRALMDLAAARPVPIPVYAEMGSFNPQFVFPGKLGNGSFAGALFASVTMGNGQFCTNPGMLFVPENCGSFLDDYKKLVAEAGAAPLLNEGIQKAYGCGLDSLREIDKIEIVGGEPGEAASVHPALAVLSLATFETNREALEEEIFGPSTVVVTCPSTEDYVRIARDFPGQLASSLHGTETDLANAGDLIEILSRYAGRVIVNGFPTGIEICHSMHHGGIYPAASDGQFTSIGLAAISRWGRPVSYQDVPDALLPDALMDANPLGIPQLVDGKMA